MNLKKQTILALIFFQTVTQILTPDLAFAASLAWGRILPENRILEWSPQAMHGALTEKIAAPKSRGTLVHIQDAHAVYEAQTSIRGLLAELKSNFDIQNLYLEGGAGKLDPLMKHLFQGGKKLSESEKEAWLREGDLTGGEAFLMDDQRVQGQGIENAQQYWANVAAYGTVANARTEIEQTVAEWERLWHRGATKKLEPELLRYLESYERSKQSAEYFSRWLDALAGYVKKNWNRDLSSAREQLDAPMFVRYLKFKKTEAELKKEKIAGETKLYIEEIASQLQAKGGEGQATLERLRKFLNETDAQDDFEKNPRELTETLVRLLPQNTAIEKYPDLRLWIARKIWASEMDVHALTDEAEAWHQKIITAPESPEVRHWIRLLDKLILLTKLLRLEVSRAEFWRLIRSKTNPHRLASELGAKTTSRENEWFVDALRFYQTAISREKDFEKSVFETLPHDSKVSVVITGGFHADALRRFAAANHLSYVQITPHVSQIDDRQKSIYEKALLGRTELRQKMFGNIRAQSTAIALATSPQIFSARPEVRGRLSATLAAPAMRSENRSGDLGAYVGHEMFNVGNNYETLTDLKVLNATALDVLDTSAFGSDKKPRPRADKLEQFIQRRLEFEKTASGKEVVKAIDDIYRKRTRDVTSRLQVMTMGRPGAALVADAARNIIDNTFRILSGTAQLDKLTVNEGAAAFDYVELFNYIVAHRWNREPYLLTSVENDDAPFVEDEASFLKDFIEIHRRAVLGWRNIHKTIARVGGFFSRENGELAFGRASLLPHFAALRLGYRPLLGSEESAYLLSQRRVAFIEVTDPQKTGGVLALQIHFVNRPSQVQNPEALPSTTVYVAKKGFDPAAAARTGDFQAFKQGFENDPGFFEDLIVSEGASYEERRIAYEKLIQLIQDGRVWFNYRDYILPDENVEQYFEMLNIGSSDFPVIRSALSQATAEYRREVISDLKIPADKITLHAAIRQAAARLAQFCLLFRFFPDREIGPQEAEPFYDRADLLSKYPILTDSVRILIGTIFFERVPHHFFLENGSVLKAVRGIVRILDENPAALRWLESMAHQMESVTLESEQEQAKVLRVSDDAIRRFGLANPSEGLPSLMDWRRAIIGVSTYAGLPQETETRHRILDQMETGFLDNLSSAGNYFNYLELKPIQILIKRVVFEKGFEAMAIPGFSGRQFWRESLGLNNAEVKSALEGSNPEKMYSMGLVADELVRPILKAITEDIPLKTKALQRLLQAVQSDAGLAGELESRRARLAELAKSENPQKAQREAAKDELKRLGKTDAAQFKKMILAEIAGLTKGLEVEIQVLRECGISVQAVKAVLANDVSQKRDWNDVDFEKHYPDLSKEDTSGLYADSAELTDVRAVLEQAAQFVRETTVSPSAKPAAATSAPVEAASAQPAAPVSAPRTQEIKQEWSEADGFGSIEFGEKKTRQFEELAGWISKLQKIEGRETNQFGDKLKNLNITRNLSPLAVSVLKVVFEIQKVKLQKFESRAAMDAAVSPIRDQIKAVKTEKNEDHKNAQVYLTEKLNEAIKPQIEAFDQAEAEARKAAEEAAKALREAAQKAKEQAENQKRQARQAVFDALENLKNINIQTEFAETVEGTRVAAADLLEANQAYFEASEKSNLNQRFTQIATAKKKAVEFRARVTAWIQQDLLDVRPGEIGTQAGALFGEISTWKQTQFIQAKDREWLSPVGDALQKEVRQAQRLHEAAQSIAQSIHRAQADDQIDFAPILKSISELFSKEQNILPSVSARLKAVQSVLTERIEKIKTDRAGHQAVQVLRDQILGWQEPAQIAEVNAKLGEIEAAIEALPPFESRALKTQELLNLARVRAESFRKSILRREKIEAVRGQIEPQIETLRQMSADEETTDQSIDQACGTRLTMLDESGLELADTQPWRDQVEAERTRLKAASKAARDNTALKTEFEAVQRNISKLIRDFDRAVPSVSEAARKKVEDALSQAEAKYKSKEIVAVLKVLRDQFQTTLDEKETQHVIFDINQRFHTFEASSVADLTPEALSELSDDIRLLEEGAVAEDTRREWATKLAALEKKIVEHKAQKQRDADAAAAREAASKAAQAQEHAISAERKMAIEKILRKNPDSMRRTLFQERVGPQTAWVLNPKASDDQVSGILKSIQTVVDLSTKLDPVAQAGDSGIDPQAKAWVMVRALEEIKQHYDLAVANAKKAEEARRSPSPMPTAKAAPAAPEKSSASTLTSRASTMEYRDPRPTLDDGQIYVNNEGATIVSFRESHVTAKVVQRVVLRTEEVSRKLGVEFSLPQGWVMFDPKGFMEANMGGERGFQAAVLAKAAKSGDEVTTTQFFNVGIQKLYLVSAKTFTRITLEISEVYLNGETSYAVIKPVKFDKEKPAEWTSQVVLRLNQSVPVGDDRFSVLKDRDNNGALAVAGWHGIERGQWPYSKRAVESGFVGVIFNPAADNSPAFSVDARLIPGTQGIVKMNIRTATPDEIAATTQSAQEVVPPESPESKPTTPSRERKTTEVSENDGGEGTESGAKKPASKSRKKAFRSAKDQAAAVVDTNNIVALHQNLRPLVPVGGEQEIQSENMAQVLNLAPHFANRVIEKANNSKAVAGDYQELIQDLFKVFLKPVQDKMESENGNEFKVLAPLWGKIVMAMLLTGQEMTADQKAFVQLVTERANENGIDLYDEAPASRSEMRLPARYLQKPEHVASMIYPFQSVAHISYEMAPFFKRGGLADVAGELPPEMKKMRPDMDIALIMPYHKDMKIDSSNPPRSVGKIRIQEGARGAQYDFEVFHLDYQGVNVFFLAHPDFFQQGYQSPDADRERIFFAKAAVELMVQRNLQFDVIHAHDQTAALVPAFVRYTRDDFFKDSAVIYTAHHFLPGYQGRMGLNRKPLLVALGMPEKLFELGGQMELHGHLNPVKSAIEISDFVTTVSQAFALDSVFSNLSDGLQGSLRRRFDEGTLVGINNGMNLDLWRPDVGMGVEVPFGEDDLDAGKAANKAILQSKLGLLTNPAAVLGVMFARFDKTKGFPLVAQTAAPLLFQFPQLQFVFGGGGDAQIAAQLLQLEANPDFRGRVRVIPSFVDERMIRGALAGADFGMAPAFAEPHGLFQLQAARGYAPPITSNAHGLGETVYDPNHGDSLHTGFKFRLGQPAVEFGMAVARFLTVSQLAPDYLRQMRRDAFKSVRSWQQIAPEYLSLYTQAIGNRRDLIRARSEMREAFEKVLALKNREDFERLKAESLLPPGVTLMEASARTLLFRQGDALGADQDPAFYVLLSGTARGTEDQAEKVNNFDIHTGEYIGERSASESTARVATIYAEAGAKLAVISRAAFQEMQKQVPELKVILRNTADVRIAENKDVRRLFLREQPEMRNLIAGISAAMKQGLMAVKSIVGLGADSHALEMTSGSLGKPTGSETGVYHGISLVGDKLYIQRVHLRGRKRISSTDVQTESVDLNLTGAQKTVDALLDRIAEEIRKRFKGSSEKIQLGIGLPFPLRSELSDLSTSAVLVSPVKSWKGTPGVDLKKALEDRIQKDCPNVVIAAVVNDGVVQLARAAYEHENVQMTVIVDEGVNIVMFLDASQVPKSRWFGPIMIVTEIADFDSLGAVMTEADRQVAAPAGEKHPHPFERLTSALYLPKVLSAFIRQRIAQKILPDTASLQDRLSALSFDDFASMANDASEDAAAVDQTLGLEGGAWTVTQKRYVRRIAKELTRRSARLMAPAIAASINQLKDRSTLSVSSQNRLGIVVRGKLFGQIPAYRKHLMDALTEIVPNAKTEIQLIENENETAGVAVVAAMASALWNQAKPREVIAPLPFSRKAARQMARILEKHNWAYETSSARQQQGPRWIQWFKTRYKDFRKEREYWIAAIFDTQISDLVGSFLAAWIPFGPIFRVFDKVFGSVRSQQAIVQLTRNDEEQVLDELRGANQSHHQTLQVWRPMLLPIKWLKQRWTTTSLLTLCKMLEVTSRHAVSASSKTRVGIREELTRRVGQALLHGVRAKSSHRIEHPVEIKAYNALRGLLNDGDSYVVKAAIEAFAGLADYMDGPQTQQILEPSDEMGHPQKNGKGFFALAEDPRQNEIVRASAAAAIGFFSYSHSLDRLRVLMRDDETPKFIKAYAMASVEKIVSRMPIQPNTYDGFEVFVRELLAYARGDSGDLQDNISLRRNSIQVLSALGWNSSDVLNELLGIFSTDIDETVQWEAFSALCQLYVSSSAAKSRIDDFLIALLQYWEDTTRDIRNAVLLDAIEDIFPKLKRYSRNSKLIAELNAAIEARKSQRMQSQSLPEKQSFSDLAPTVYVTIDSSLPDDEVMKRQAESDRIFRCVKALKAHAIPTLLMERYQEERRYGVSETIIRENGLNEAIDYLRHGRGVRIPARSLGSLSADRGPLVVPGAGKPVVIFGLAKDMGSVLAKYPETRVIDLSEFSGLTSAVKDEQRDAEEAFVANVTGMTQQTIERPADYPKPSKDNPPYYTSPDVLKNSRSGTNPEGEADSENISQGQEPLTSFEGEVQVDAQGYPINKKKIGLKGRGSLFRWGANPVEDLVLTRVNPESGDYEMLVVKRSDTNQWTLLGGFRRRKETEDAALIRIVKYKTGFDITPYLAEAQEVRRGRVDDMRQTDNAWVETHMRHIHLGEFTDSHLWQPQPGAPNIKAVQWVNISPRLIGNLYASHGSSVVLALQNLVYPRSRRSEARAPDKSILESTPQERSESREVVVAAARRFALGILPLSFLRKLLAIPAHAAEAVNLAIPFEADSLYVQAQEMLLGKQTLHEHDAFVLRSDLALKHGFLVAVKKVFPGTVFAVIVPAIEIARIKAWVAEENLNDVVVVAENLQQARMALLKKNSAVIIRGLALTASAESAEFGDLPVVTFTAGQLDRMLSFAGLVAEAARLAQFARAFAVAA